MEDGGGGLGRGVITAEGEELRAGIALFNNSGDIEKLLDVTGT